jgi:NAD(P)H-dependent FMN reductase
MARIIGISGSLRAGSFNSALLRAARNLFPDSVSIASIRGIPLYDADLEAEQGIPTLVEQLKNRIEIADGLLLATPEYNNSMPGVFKNALDWLSRPPSDVARVFHGKAVALIGATPGGFGTALAQNAWLTVLRTLKTRPWLEGRLMVSHAGKQFDESGNLIDDTTRVHLDEFVRGFIAFAVKQPRQ